ncbi:hypothetical protein J3459_019217 [Metarhizium acridum]|uniref:uncharacterized protein n=1 Tax=Metarhizium acridum TaxID=92637 RepID=UPI001C6C1AB4|nr:hypothetical protein J3459_019217 [Metarhizium acridum]KAG8410123.1 hypothetical protein J3458_019191 [Metarhizium acridum]
MDGTPAVYASRSRASSFNEPGPSVHTLDGPRTSRDISPLPHLSRSASPVASGSGTLRQRAGTPPVGNPAHMSCMLPLLYQLHPVETEADRGQVEILWKCPPRCILTPINTPRILDRK